MYREVHVIMIVFPFKIDYTASMKKTCPALFKIQDSVAVFQNKELEIY